VATCLTCTLNEVGCRCARKTRAGPRRTHSGSALPFEHGNRLQTHAAPREVLLVFEDLHDVAIRGRRLLNELAREVLRIHDETSSPSPDASRPSSLCLGSSRHRCCPSRVRSDASHDAFGLVRRLIRTVTRLIRAVTRRVRADRIAAQAGS
jgi:hypothetical protein